MNNTISLDKYKLVIFDIDGTLVDFNQNLHNRTRTIIQKYQQSHIPVTVATGKNWDAVKNLGEELGIEIPLILANGTMLMTVKGELIDKAQMPQDKLPRIFEICDQVGIDLLVYLDGELYVKKTTGNVTHMLSYGSTRILEAGDWDSIKDRMPDIHKVMVIDFQNPQAVFDFEKIIVAEFGDCMDYCHPLKGMFEMMPKGVSKGTAIQSLCNYLGISPEMVIAFGDGNNDAEMLTMVGLGVTLANASAIAKAHADLLVPSVERCGPAQLMEYLMDGKTAAL